MKEFFIYCFRCLGTVISTAFGNTPDNSTFKEDVIGFLVLISISFIFILLFLIYALIMRKVRKR